MQLLRHEKRREDEGELVNQQILGVSTVTDTRLEPHTNMLVGDLVKHVGSRGSRPAVTVTSFLTIAKRPWIQAG